MFFLELSCFFNDTVDVGNLFSGSYVFSKTNLNIWKFVGHVLLKPGLELPIKAHKMTNLSLFSLKYTYLLWNQEIKSLFGVIFSHLHNDILIKPGSPAFQADALTSDPPGKPNRNQV